MEEHNSELGDKSCNESHISYAAFSRRKLDANVNPDIISYKVKFDILTHLFLILKLSGVQKSVFDFNKYLYCGAQEI